MPSNAFKGETPGMHGSAFEVFRERGEKRQLKEILQAFEQYTRE